MGVPFTMPRDSTPNRLLALTRRSSFSTQMPLLNSLAFWIKNVAGRACKPTSLLTVISCVYMLQLSFFISNQMELVAHKSFLYHHNRFSASRQWRIAQTFQKIFLVSKVLFVSLCQLSIKLYVISPKVWEDMGEIRRTLTETFPPRSLPFYRMYLDGAPCRRFPRFLKKPSPAGKSHGLPGGNGRQ